MAYGYQYIPHAPGDDGRVRPVAMRIGGGGRVHPLDRAASAIAEAIAAVYRDIDDLRRTIPDVMALADEQGVEVGSRT